MIDEKCPIYRAGNGYCWTSSAAWNCSDTELCVKCKLFQEKKAAIKEIVTEVITVVIPQEKGGSRSCNRCGQPVWKNTPMCTDCVNIITNQKKSKKGKSVCVGCGRGTYGNNTMCSVCKFKENRRF